MVLNGRVYCTQRTDNHAEILHVTGKFFLLPFDDMADNTRYCDLYGGAQWFKPFEYSLSWSAASFAFRHTFCPAITVKVSTGAFTPPSRRELSKAIDKCLLSSEKSGETKCSSQIRYRRGAGELVLQVDAFTNEPLRGNPAAVVFTHRNGNAGPGIMLTYVVHVNTNPFSTWHQ